MTLSDFKGKHPGCRAFIIGKGPSLDRIEEIRSELNSDNAVIFCVNESIHKIEFIHLDVPVYCGQQDSELEFDCVPTYETTVHFMQRFQHSPSSKRKEIVTVSPWNPNAVLYGYPEIAGNTTLTALVAVKLAKYMGIEHVTFCCFDSWSNGWKGSGEYAKCIGKESGAKNGVGRHAGNGCWIWSEAKKMINVVDTLFPVVTI